MNSPIYIDPSIIAQIQDDGVIENNNLWRRWITAQTYKSFIQSGLSSSMRNYDAKFFSNNDMRYAFKNIAREIRMQDKSVTFPSFIDIDIIKSILDEYKHLVLRRTANDIKTKPLDDEQLAVYKLPAGTKLLDNIMHRDGSRYYYNFNKDNGWYRRQYDIIRAVFNGTNLSSPYMTNNITPAVTREYKFKNKTFRMIDVMTIDKNNTPGIERVLNEIIKSIKTPHDFVELVDSNVLDIIPVSMYIDKNQTTYRRVFKAVGAYYTMQNFVMFHNYTGITMDELTAMATPDVENMDSLWETFIDNIENGDIMDYLIQTQIDEI